jgi:hypothetical protein
MLDTGYWILDSGYWILDAGYWILDAGYWILDTRFWILDRYLIIDIEHLMLGEHIKINYFPDNSLGRLQPEGLLAGR